MKTRKGFVSNSSSSSFIVIDNSGNNIIPDFNGNILYIPESFKESIYPNNFQFGWEEIEYHDFPSKLNWCVLCTMYKPEMPWLEMLTEVLKEDLHIEKIVNNLQLDSEGNPAKSFAYIDHQSTPNENYDNAYMFKDKELLRNFLYNKRSYIQGGNDN
jgi:hypothetical protein